MGIGHISDPHGLPGINVEVSSNEVQVWFGNASQNHFDAQAVLDSTTVDASQTPDTQLLAGLVMGVITATKKWVQYDDAAIDGSEVAKGVLNQAVDMIGQAGVVADRQGQILVKGNLLVAKLNGLDAAARVDLKASNQFIFDDEIS